MGIVMVNHYAVYSQNLDKLTNDEDWFQFNGGSIQGNFIANQAINQNQFRDPYAHVISGSINFSILDVSLPFSFSFANSQITYAQPFNMMALHPTYKKLKTHIGITNMPFSQYTYNGLNFTGAGAEYAWDKISIKGFGGRLNKAIAFDPIVDNRMTMGFARYGGGVSVGFKLKEWENEVILFKGTDVANSLQSTNPNPELVPQDNVVASVKTKGTIAKVVQLELEHASSFSTRNVRALSDSESRNWYDFLINGNTSSTYSSAWKGSLGYRYKVFGIALKYERVAPEYSTLGGLYFNNDLENISIAPTLVLFQNKLNINLNAGVERNNLLSNKANNTKRWVGSAAINAQLTKGMNLALNYSNFASFTRRNPLADPLYSVIADTLNYYQVSQNFTSSWNYTFGEKIKQAMNFTATYNLSTNITGRLDNAVAFGFNTSSPGQEIPVDVYNVLFAHTFRIPKGKWGIGYIINATHTEALGMQNSLFGPGLTLSKPLKEKILSFNTGVTYNRQFLNLTAQNHVMNIRLGLRYNPKFENEKYGKLSASLTGNYCNRLSLLPGEPAPQNLTMMLNLSYSFK